jgi:hypothetical protein
MIHPAYAGGSILNLPASICRLLGVPDLGSMPLIDEISSQLGLGPVRRVIVLLVDALSLHRFRRWIAAGSLPLWDRLIQDGSLAPLTSIVPSTTSAALTSLLTGLSSAMHGIAGYELWLKEYGVVANMILHSPMSFRGNAFPPGSLSAAGFQPEAYLATPTLSALSSPTIARLSWRSIYGSC